MYLIDIFILTWPNLKGVSISALAASTVDIRLLYYRKRQRAISTRKSFVSCLQAIEVFSIGYKHGWSQ